MLKNILSMLAITASVAIASAAHAEPTPNPSPSPITRTVLQKAEYPGDTYASILVKTDILPGVSGALHTHPGVELTFMESGEGTLSIAGQPDRQIKAGDSFAIPSGAQHRFVNTSSANPVRFVTTYVVEKDKPLATNVVTK